MLKQLLFSFFFLFPLCSEIEIHFVKSAEEIDQVRSQEILVKSFMDGYEDVPLVDLNPDFKSTGDVRRFYEEYFHEEFGHFKEGHLTWVEAYFDSKLVGWATFELEPHEADAAYMNLLVVDPEFQGNGAGKELTFSICELFPNIKAINLLIRKVNAGGYKFYYKMGFFDFDYERDNFVDTSLLTGLRWEKISG